jgi:pimeloyl-ACP methyl ester carboxylesterase
VRCPTLLIAGENDPFANTNQLVTMKREIPDAEWLIVNNSGHAVHAEHPEIVGPRIVEFLLRHS